jgi:hypothetical protein
MEEGSMRSLWVPVAAIGAAILILAHASFVGVVIGVALVGLSVLLLFKPLRPVSRSTAIHS